MNTKQEESLSTVELVQKGHGVPQVVNQGAVAQSPNPAVLLQMAVQQGADLDRLERLMALQERWEANEAKKAFTDAMSRFKADPPDIFKDKQVGYETRDGGYTGYKHATLGNVCEKVVAALANVGISHKWDLDQSGGMVRVTCVLTHRLGHSESTRMEAGADNSGKKNSIQAVASTISYLERYTLLAATGLATKDQDDDAGTVDTSGDQEVITFSLSGILSRLDEAEDEEQVRAIRKEGLAGASNARDKYAYDLITKRVAERRKELGVVIDAEGGQK